MGSYKQNHSHSRGRFPLSHYISGRYVVIAARVMVNVSDCS